MFVYISSLLVGLYQIVSLLASFIFLWLSNYILFQHFVTIVELSVEIMFLLKQILIELHFVAHQFVLKFYQPLLPLSD